MHFNPRSPHGERPIFSKAEEAVEAISIHAPRTGSDKRFQALRLFGKHFNPRSPHGERPDLLCCYYWRGIFQSTLPARGATFLTALSVSPSFDFNPRSPHGERRHALLTDFSYMDFNPRSPHGERQYHSVVLASDYRFQSTLPARGATLHNKTSGNANMISIHAPRTGSDRRWGTDNYFFIIDFNPRSPHGERRKRFQALRLFGKHFNPRSPHGERRSGWVSLHRPRSISIHAPRTGSDKTTST